MSDSRIMWNQSSLLDTHLHFLDFSLVSGSTFVIILPHEFLLEWERKDCTADVDQQGFAAMKMRMRESSTPAPLLFWSANHQLQLQDQLWLTSSPHYCCHHCHHLHTDDWTPQLPHLDEGIARTSQSDRRFVKDGCSDQSWSTLLPTLLAELLACHSRKPGTWESNLSLCRHVHTHSSHVWIIMFLHGAFSWKNLSWFYQSLSLSHCMIMSLHESMFSSLILSLSWV